jgi:hypothetical protein
MATSAAESRLRMGETGRAGLGSCPRCSAVDTRAHAILPARNFSQDATLATLL